MTAGSGIMHQEMPRATNHMLGLQVWINLPQKDKMVSPNYSDVRADMVKTIAEEHATVKVVAGVRFLTRFLAAYMCSYNHQ